MRATLGSSWGWSFSPSRSPRHCRLVAGAILLPHNDDFGFRRIALTLAQTGRLDLIGWPNMTIVGQILFAVPFLVAVGGEPLSLRRGRQRP